MYPQKYKPDHHRADVTGLVAVHVLVAEKHLGRSIQKGEIIHHKDFNKLNSKQANLLFPITRLQHQKIPEYQARFIIAKGLYNEFLKWWVQEQENDEANREIKKLEIKLVKAENDKERLQKNGNI